MRRGSDEPLRVDMILTKTPQSKRLLSVGGDEGQRSVSSHRYDRAILTTCNLILRQQVPLAERNFRRQADRTRDSVRRNKDLLP